MHGLDSPSKPREFLRRAFSEWGSAVTGGISAPLFLGAIFLASSEWLRLAGMATAAGCVYFSAYRVWKREREARDSVEAQLYSDASMKGKAYIEIGGYNPYEDQTKAGCFFKVSVDSRNTGRTPCTIGALRIGIHPPDGVFVPWFGVPIDIEPEKIEHEDFFRYSSEAILQPGMFPDDLRKSRVLVILIDGAQKEHPLNTSISPRILDRTF